MTLGNAGITGTEFSPIGSLETLRKDGPTGDFSVIRQKGDGTITGVSGTLGARSCSGQPEQNGEQHGRLTFEQYKKPIQSRQLNQRDEILNGSMMSNIESQA